jgi:transcription initiation factor TFIIIB Brf1 subunit/transcription initiation factor TFIIB
MCWMHEWAKAHRHIDHAIIHIQRAAEKMYFRSNRFPKKRARYLVALERCDDLVRELREIQSILRALIDEYGVKRGKRYNKTLQKLLTPPKLQPPEEWARRN